MKEKMILRMKMWVLLCVGTFLMCPLFLISSAILFYAIGHS